LVSDTGVAVVVGLNNPVALSFAQPGMDALVPPSATGGASSKLGFESEMIAPEAVAENMANDKKASRQARETTNDN